MTYLNVSFMLQKVSRCAYPYLRIDWEVKMSGLRRGKGPASSVGNDRNPELDMSYKTVFILYKLQLK